MPRMRRRMRSAAFPVHRHSRAAGRAGRGAGRARLLPRLPAALRRAASRPLYEDLLERTIGGRGRRQLVVLRARSASTGSWWRYSSQREYFERSLQAVVRRDARADRRTSRSSSRALISPRRGFDRASRADRRDRALLPADARASSAARASSCARSTSGRCAACAPRRDARAVLIVGAGDGGRLLLREILRNPELGLPPGRLRRRRPAQAGHAHRPGVARAAARPASSAACSTTSSPTRCSSRSRRRRARCARRSSRACRERGIPVRTLPTVFELLRTGGAPAAPGARGAASRTCSGASRCGWRSSASAAT